MADLKKQIDNWLGSIREAEAEAEAEGAYWTFKMNVVERSSCEACGEIDAWMHILNDDPQKGTLCDDCFYNPDLGE